MKKMTKVLIANRGEVSLRIIRACRELGLKTVAVYSRADKNSMHVYFADEAYCIGYAPPLGSYLRMDRIIEVAKRSGADAIHPGYGFLSERDDFAQACADEGIKFIGPSPESLAAMGNKATARATVIKAGVPVVPGLCGSAGLMDEEMIAFASQTGYPLVIKSAGGGGGKGMRTVHSSEDLLPAFASARREALSAFGTDAVYLEKLIQEARHIEIQIMADTHGNIIYLGERECSIQRRHQKIIEEAPSPFVHEDHGLRMKLGNMACRAAAAAGYVNAGTVEFLVDREKNFYFLEMNARLQVEHGVTEMVTGIDIVKEQIRIAQGHALSYTQAQVAVSGWAVECRINAEDPYNNFMPSPGKVTAASHPSGPGVRVETGVYEGYDIPHFYDSMISKVICWGVSRDEALLRMRRALQELKISGVKTNIFLHQSILDSPEFQDGDFDTQFLENHSDLIQEEPLYPESEDYLNYSCICV